MMITRLAATLSLVSIALAGTTQDTPPPKPSIEIVDITKPLQVKTKSLGRPSGRWEAELRLDLKVTNGATPAMTITSPDDPALTSTISVTPNAPAMFRIARITVSGTSKLPTAVLLTDPNLAAPVRFQIPAPPVQDNLVDRIVLGSLIFAAVVVAIGTLIAGKSVWTNIGTQQWTFDSWATNTAVGAGILALVLKIIPGADVPFTQLSAILGFIGGIAPIAYNLTTRAVGPAQQSKVIFFALSAILTGAAVFGQLQIAFSALHATPGKIPLGSLTALDVIIILVGVAFVFHLFVGVRDAIKGQTAPPPAGHPRYSLPMPGGGSSFKAL